MYCSESAVVLTREESVVVARCMHDEEEFPSVRALCSAAAAANFCSDTLAAPSACDLPNAPIQHPISPTSSLIFVFRRTVPTQQLLATYRLVNDNVSQRLACDPITDPGVAPPSTIAKRCLLCISLVGRHSLYYTNQSKYQVSCVVKKNRSKWNRKKQRIY